MKPRNSSRRSNARLSRPPELMQAIKAFGDAIHPYHDGHSSERVLDAIDAFIAAGGRNRKSKPLNFWRKLQVAAPHRLLGSGVSYKPVHGPVAR